MKVVNIAVKFSSAERLLLPVVVVELQLVLVLLDDEVVVELDELEVDEVEEVELELDETLEDETDELVVEVVTLLWLVVVLPPFGARTRM